MLDVKLVVVGGDAKAAEIKLKLPVVIGRGKEAGLTVPHALVSRRHTEIVERNGRLFVRDLGSLNGTFINNRKIESEQPLDPNQLLTLGNVTFRAVYEIQTKPAVPVGSRQSNAGEDAQEKTELVKTNAPSIPFDETVSVESLVRKQSQNNTKPSPDRQAAKPEDADPSQSVTIDADQPAAASAGDTDKSFLGSDDTACEASAIASDVFVFEDAQNINDSVSISALGDLPSAKSAVSFKGDLELDEGIVAKPLSQIEPVEIELGEEAEVSQAVANDSTLGSFLRKLPR